MSKVKFVLNRAGVRELLQSQEMQAVIEEATQNVLTNAGGQSAGYDANVITGKNRVVGRVYADTIRAKRSNSKHNTLLKALR